MKTKIILIITFLSLICILHADYKSPKKSENTFKIIVENKTNHNLRVALDIQEKGSRNVELINPEEFKRIKASDTVSYLDKNGAIMGYKDSQFKIEILNDVMGISTRPWMGNFTGSDSEYDHTFEYRPVVLNPKVISKIVKLHFSASYKDGTMTLIFSSPQ